MSKHTLAKINADKLTQENIDELVRCAEVAPLSVMHMSDGLAMLVNTNEFELLNLSLLECGLREFYEENDHPDYILIVVEF